MLDEGQVLSCVVEKEGITVGLGSNGRIRRFVKRIQHLGLLTGTNTSGLSAGTNTSGLASNRRARRHGCKKGVRHTDQANKLASRQRSG